MTREAHVATGTAGGCLFNGCVTLCVLLLVTFVSAWIWLGTQPARDEAKARADLRANVETRRQHLSQAAADGILQDTEIIRLFPAMKPAGGLVDIGRQGQLTTVIAEMLGSGPPRAFILVRETMVEGCFAFRVPLSAHGAPSVSVRQLSDEACAASTSPSEPTR